MRQGVPNRRLLLAMDRIFGPIPGDWRVVLNQPSIHLHVQCCGGDRLGDGIDVEQSVAVHRAADRFVGEASPSVNRQASLIVGCHLHADFGARGYGLFDCCADSGVGLSTAAHECFGWRTQRL